MELLDIEVKDLNRNRWSSGFNLVDIMLGGGLTSGIIEVFGPPSIGKSALASQIAGHRLVCGSCVQHWDQERVFDLDPKRVAMLMGAELGAYIQRDKKGNISKDSQFIPVRADHLEELLEKSEEQAAYWRYNELLPVDEPIVVLLDSLASTETLEEDKRSYQKQEMASMASALSRNLRKFIKTMSRYRMIFLVVNQVRKKVGVLFGKNTDSPGGEAIKFYANMRIEMNRIGKLDGGAEVSLTTIKNKISYPYRKLVLPFYYASGFSNADSAIGTLCAFGYAKHTSKNLMVRPSLKKDFVKYPLPLNTAIRSKLMGMAEKVYAYNDCVIKTRFDK